MKIKKATRKQHIVTLLTVMPEISRTSDPRNIPSYSTVETIKIHVAMEIIIHLIIRDPQFTASMVNTYHKTDNDNMAKKTRKRWALNMFYEGLTRTQLIFE